MSQKPRKVSSQTSTIHKCDLCDFTTKNAFFFKRHKVRCRKEHGFVRGRGKSYRKLLQSVGGSVTSSSQLDSTLDDSQDVVDGTEQDQKDEVGAAEELPKTETEAADGSSKMTIESSAEHDTSETSSIQESEVNSGPELNSIPLKPGAVKKRVYQCSKCLYTTKSSREFLYHEVQEHSSKFNIYSCQNCQYSSRHRHKVIRHATTAHGVDGAAMANMMPEFIGSQAPHIAKPRSSQGKVRVKAVGKKVMVKHGASKRKFLVKFGKPEVGGHEQAPSQDEVTDSEAASVSSEPLNASIPKQTDQLLRVVKEVDLGNGQVIYKCRECTYVNEDKQQVAKHAVSWHVDTKSFTCSHCDYISFERNDFVAHRLTHRNEHQFKCEECTYSTDFRPNYDRHLSNHQGSFPFNCKICTFGSGSEAVVRRHMVNNHVTAQPEEPTPPPAKKLKLPVPRTASSGDLSAVSGTVAALAESSALQAFKKSATIGSRKSLSPPKPKNKLPPPQKRKDLSGSFHLNAPQSDSQSSPYQFNKSLFLESDSVSMVPRPVLPLPDVENAAFLSRDLSPHRKLPPNITQYVEKDEGRLLCPICKLKYKRSSDLNRHMKRKHGLRLREYLENFADGEPIPGLDMAALNFDDEIELDDLDEKGTDADNEDSNIMEGVESPLDLSGKTDSEDSPVSPRKLKCKYCSYQAKWMSDLKRHYSVHSIQKRYKCNYCPKKYKYVGDLNVHVRKGHGKEPGAFKTVMVATAPKERNAPALFKCPCCNYTSVWKSELDRHSRMHTGEKNYKCKSCDYSTHWRGDMRRHVYRKHPEIMVEGVSLNDVVIRNKDRAPEILPGNVEQSPQFGAVMTDDSVQSMDASFPSDGERLSREVTPVKLNVPRSHEPSPEINMSDYVTKSMTGHSPTPSPIKDLGAGMFKCQYCGFVANAPSKMDSHIATHTNLKRYMCPLCGRRANWKWDIAKHIRKDHNDQVAQVIKLTKQEAEETIQAYIDSNPVVRRDHHLNVRNEKLACGPSEHFFKCSLCDFSAEKRISVARHIRFMHMSGGRRASIIMVKRSPEKISPSSQSQMRPELVSASYAVPGLSITGNLTPTQVTPTKSEMQPVQVTPTKPVQMPVKAAITSSPSVVTPSKYTSLIENFGPQDAARPFMCSECGKRGATKGDVKKHYHYAHVDKEIRIIYLGDGSQSVYAAKTDIGPGMPEKPVPEATVQLTSSPPAMQPALKEDGKSVLQPKVVGYIRPFVCGLCGRRSNWRWDMNKHIRMRHRGQDVKVIQLSEGEARATIQDYVKNVLPALNKETAPKRKSRDSVYGYPDGKSPAMSIEQINLEQMEYSNASSNDSSNMNSDANQASDNARLLAGQFKQYKCSGCAYRSNFRSDILRHIPRRHGQNAKVIFLDKETAKATLATYKYTRSYKPVQDPKKAGGSEQHHHAARTIPSGPLPKEAWAGLEKKIWKCSMCSFSDEDKVNVLKHVGKHNLKAYKCTACNWTSNFRSAVQRHIQSKHPLDESAQCKLSIKLIKEGPGVDQSGRSIMPDGIVPDQSTSLDSAEPLAAQQGAVTGQQSMSNPQSFISTALFFCRICNYSSNWRSCVCRHIRKIHKRKDFVAQIVKKIVRTSIDVSSSETTGLCTESPGKAGELGFPPPRSWSPRKKNFHCTMCPYKTYKGKMLKFHMTCHKQQPGVKQVKCKYCPYYVSSNRLLSQHINLHLQDFMSSDSSRLTYPLTPVKSPSASPASSIRQSPQAPKRHRCEKCPYTTNSKNDFFYHKQFHRPKPTADFKCDYCDYWVSHRRLIKQHMKVHQGQQDDDYTSDSILTPSKSEYSENSLVYDTVEIAAIKQRIIASKITPSISQSPLVSPMKIAANCSVGGRRSFLRKDGSYRKIHQCRHCPYMNIRLRNMKLHEMMHGRRSATHPLMKCPHCDYYVGSKGLLGHHLKVHQPDYGVDFIGHEKNRRNSQTSEDSEIDSSCMSEQSKVDTLLEITRFKKYGCEKCPYATSKRARFQRHVEMHGSKQRCKCDFCDYSVPTMNLLNQHSRLHFEPNQNLLCAQSILNLQYLPEMPADVALASMMTNSDSKHPVSITHDHIDLYENQPEDLEPKKLYRCDRCPYANVRRDHLLAHLRCHMVKNEFACPYCDYSVGKNHVLVQHVKVHFSPLPEFSEWLEENGNTERIKEVKNRNLSEALEVTKMFQNEKKEDQKAAGEETGTDQEKAEETKDRDAKVEKKEDTSKSKEDKLKGEVKEENGKSRPVKGEDEQVKMDLKKQDSVKKEDTIAGSINVEDKYTKKREADTPETEVTEKMGTDEKEAKTLAEDGTEKENTEQKDEMMYVCQYCDRDFQTSDHLVRHEMQHLVGNSYEELVTQLLKAAEAHQLDKPSASVVNGDGENQSGGEDCGESSTKELKALLNDSKDKKWEEVAMETD